MVRPLFGYGRLTLACDLSSSWDGLSTFTFAFAVTFAVTFAFTVTFAVTFRLGGDSVLAFRVVRRGFVEVLGGYGAAARIRYFDKQGAEVAVFGVLAFVQKARNEGFVFDTEHRVAANGTSAGGVESACTYKFQKLSHGVFLFLKIRREGSALPSVTCLNQLTVALWSAQRW